MCFQRVVGSNGFWKKCSKLTLRTYWGMYMTDGSYAGNIIIFVGHEKENVNGCVCRWSMFWSMGDTLNAVRTFTILSLLSLFLLLKMCYRGICTCKLISAISQSAFKYDSPKRSVLVCAFAFVLCALRLCVSTHLFSLSNVHILYFQRNVYKALKLHISSSIILFCFVLPSSFSYHLFTFLMGWMYLEAFSSKNYLCHQTRSHTPLLAGQEGKEDLGLLVKYSYFLLFYLKG